MKILKFLIFIVFAANLSLIAQTQLKEKSPLLLKEKNNLIGTSFGFWMHGSSPILGANYEREFKQIGAGVVGVGAIIRFWSYIEKYSYAEVNYNNTFLGAQANYNLNKAGIGNFIPFAGLVTGYNFISDKYRSYDDNSLIAYDKTYKSGFLIWAQAGMRYFINPKLAASLRLGLGNLDFSSLELGIDIKL